jgi:hypothetical protein
MNNSGRRTLVLGLIVAALIIIAGGIWGIQAWSQHQQNAVRTSLASGYATQPLAAPFKFLGRLWLPKSGPLPSSGQWQYLYSVNLSPAAALAAAKVQFARGAYQVVEGQPDVTTTTGGTLYRDLITEDVGVKFQVPGPGQTHTSSATTTTSVTLSPLAGN